MQVDGSGSIRILIDLELPPSDDSAAVRHHLGSHATACLAETKRILALSERTRNPGCPIRANLVYTRQRCQVRRTSRKWGADDCD
jgi:hypothetical protein